MKKINKKLIYRSSAAAVIAIAIAIVVVINLLAQLIPFKIDLTGSGIYTLSDTSKEIITGIDKDITIYGLFDTNDAKTDDSINELYQMMTRYAEFSNIDCQYIDPEKNPQFVKEVSNNSATADKIAQSIVVVKSGENVRAFEEGELFETTKEDDAIYKDASLIEQCLTGAIKLVSAVEVPTVYFITGHNEVSITEDYKILREYLLSNNFDVRELDLSLKSSVPSDAKILICMAPQKDFMASERDAIAEYMNDGGDFILMINSLKSAIDFPNINYLTNKYNIDIQNDKIKETNPDFYIPGDEYTIAVSPLDNAINGTTITKSIPKVTVSEARSLNIRSKNTEDITNTTLVVTSTSARSTHLGENGEKNGPFEVAVAGENKTTTDPSRIVVMGDATFVSDSQTQQLGSNENISIFVKWLTWMQDIKDEKLIEAKPYDVGSLKVTYGQANIIFAIFVVIFPLCIMAIGFVVWIRRRHL